MKANFVSLVEKSLDPNCRICPGYDPFTSSGRRLDIAGLMRLPPIERYEGESDDHLRQRILDSLRESTEAQNGSRNGS